MSAEIPPQSDSKARLAKVVHLWSRLSSALLRNILEHCNKSTLKRIRLAIGRAGQHIAFEHATSILFHSWDVDDDPAIPARVLDPSTPAYVLAAVRDLSAASCDVGQLVIRLPNLRFLNVEVTSSRIEDLCTLLADMSQRDVYLYVGIILDSLDYAGRDLQAMLKPMIDATGYPTWRLTFEVSIPPSLLNTWPPSLEGLSTLVAESRTTEVDAYVYWELSFHRWMTAEQVRQFLHLQRRSRLTELRWAFGPLPPGALHDCLALVGDGLYEISLRDYSTQAPKDEENLVVSCSVLKLAQWRKHFLRNLKAPLLREFALHDPNFECLVTDPPLQLSRYFIKNLPKLAILELLDGCHSRGVGIDLHLFVAPGTVNFQIPDYLLGCIVDLKLPVTCPIDSKWMSTVGRLRMPRLKRLSLTAVVMGPQHAEPLGYPQRDEIADNFAALLRQVDAPSCSDLGINVKLSNIAKLHDFVRAIFEGSAVTRLSKLDVRLLLDGHCWQEAEAAAFRDYITAQIDRCGLDGMLSLDDSCVARRVPLQDSAIYSSPHLHHVMGIKHLAC